MSDCSGAGASIRNRSHPADELLEFAVACARRNRMTVGTAPTIVLSMCRPVQNARNLNFRVATKRASALLCSPPARLGTTEANPADDRCDTSDDAQRGKSFHEPGKLRRVCNP